MTQIDFYILQGTTLADRSQFVCRLCKKIFGQGHKIYIHCDNEQQAHEIDELLWSIDASSFLPHKLRQSELNASPIEIGFGDIDPKHHGEVLINFGTSRAPFFAQFDRLAEVVVQVDEIKEACRDNYKFYKQRNYPINNHQIAV